MTGQQREIDMPIFEYVCKKCEKNFEELTLSSSQKVECPDCGSKKVEKLFSAFSSGSGSGQTANRASCGSFG